MLSILKKINLALKVSIDQASSRMFNKGIFLTLTSSRGGFGPAIQASGNVKIRFVDVDTLPGLLGVGSAGLVPAKYAQRDFNVLINVVKESTQYLNSLNKLAMHTSNMSNALLTNKSAKEMAGWPDDSESTLVRGKSAMEMAGLGKDGSTNTFTLPDSAAWPVANFRGLIEEYRMGSHSDFKMNKGKIISKKQKDSLNQLYPLPPSSNVNFWRNKK
jgi:hypothetical protein